MEIVDAHIHLWTPETHHWLQQMVDKAKAAGNTGWLCRNTSIADSHHTNTHT